MSNTRLTVCLLVAASSLPPTVSEAQLRTRVTGQTALAFTDNVDGTEANKRADGYTEIQPGLTIYLGTREAAHELQCSLALALFFRSFENNSTVTGRLGWTSLIFLSDRLRLRLLSGGSVGQTNLASLGESADSSGAPGGIVAGSQWFVSGSVAQGLDYDLGPGDAPEPVAEL
jgi:hypothetical protein